jgi:hypothetical protein
MHIDDWIAIGTWATAAATALLAIFAYLAWNAAKDERVENRDHFERQLAEAETAHRMSLRPILVIDRAFHHHGDGVYEVTFRNVGSGPALECVVEAWFSDKVLSQADAEAGTSRDTIVAGRRSEWQTHSAEVISPAESGTFLFRPAGHPDIHSAVFKAAYRDAFDQRLPRPGDRGFDGDVRRIK